MIEFLNPDLKRERGYKHAKSKVFASGREILQGLDWTRRVKELAERSGGRCENIIKGNWGYYGIPGGRCIRAADDPHHLQLRSKLRDDRMENLLAVCRTCHELLDREQREAIRVRNRKKIDELRGAA
jgi:hypothetical protein